MLTLNLVKGTKVVNLSSMGEGVLWTAITDRANVQNSASHAAYFETTKEADENVILDAAYLLDEGWNLAD